MRVAIRGRRGLDDLRRSLMATIDRLEGMGVTHAWGINFYLNPCDAAGDGVILVGDDGTEVEMLEIADPKKHEVPAASRTKPRKAPKPPKSSSNVVPFARK